MEELAMRQPRKLLRVAMITVVALPRAALWEFRCNGPSREHLRRLGNGMVVQIERYRSIHGRYPESLKAAGLSQPTYHYFGFEYELFKREEGKFFELSIGDYILNGFVLYWNRRMAHGGATRSPTRRIENAPLVK
jgi:hypothetical protein